MVVMEQVFDPRAQKGRKGSRSPASPSTTQALTGEGIPMARGSRWGPGTVFVVLRSLALDQGSVA